MRTALASGTSSWHDASGAAAAIGEAVAFSQAARHAIIDASAKTTPRSSTAAMTRTRIARS
jgi:hypothetical protein